jgi:GR25 family glycosyltransferase involved in LPS biosynthesis
MQHNIYMIAMEDHPISLMYQREVLPSWKNYKVNTFNAITPKDLYKKHKLDFGVKGEREFTSTEKAVWYSHFELWCICYSKNLPVTIIEHDSKLIKPLPDMSQDGYKLLSYINRDFGKKGIYIAPGSGYYITPTFAQRLIVSAVTKIIKQNSDGHLGNIMNFKRQNALDDYHYIEQINIDGLNTIDHQNIHRKFVGPSDYENFDLPSVYRKAL